MRPEVRQVAQAQRHAGQRRRQRQRGRIGVVADAVDAIAVHLGAERGLDLRHAAAEADAVGIGRDVVDGETLRTQPGLHRGQVVLAHAEAVAVLRRRQPGMVAGRGRVLLLLQQLVERLLLRIRQTEVQRYAVQHLLGVGPALVVARLRQRMLRAGQRHRRAGPERAG
ncbi:MAG: hypothetical protein OSA97_12600, partial [Nevskia sp.]|nr:hypothetical protein [Nevskia sp.]